MKRVPLNGDLLILSLMNADGPVADWTYHKERDMQIVACWMHDPHVVVTVALLLVQALHAVASLDYGPTKKELEQVMALMADGAVGNVQSVMWDEIKSHLVMVVENRNAQMSDDQPNPSVPF